jgi:hypothetical protein
MDRGQAGLLRIQGYFRPVVAATSVGASSRLPVK